MSFGLACWALSDIISIMEKDKDIKLVAIVGMCGSGKSTAVDYLTERNIPKVYFGGVVINAVKEAGLEVNEANEKMMREKLREDEGKDAIVSRVVKDAKKLIEAGQKRIVLDGLYSWTEYKVLRKEFPDEMTVVAIVTPKALRRERLANRPIRPLTPAEVAERDRSEIENLEKGGPIAAADYYILNNGPKEEIYTRLDEILKEIEF